MAGRNKWISLGVLALLIALLPLFFPSGYYYRVGALIFVNALSVVGLVILIGYAGQISLGHAGFAAIEKVERFLDSVAHFATGGSGDLVAIVESGLDRRLKGLQVVLHRGVSLILNGYFLHSAANSSFTGSDRLFS